ncbi:MAG TPA: helix-turn-helix transcriptional regulator [Acidimicrobiales bacterium]|nr:helix-turn-helix transcriptional regulator [Acidimicrobiales bacterium]
MTLRARREAARRTAAELSESAQVPLDTVRALESGRVVTPSFLTVAALGRALDLSLDELVAVAWEDG